MGAVPEPPCRIHTTGGTAIFFPRKRTSPGGVVPGMIARWWRGWTTRTNADAYEELLRTTILPGIHRIAGYRGAELLRREVGDEVEFATLTLWESLEAVRAFAGEDYETAVVPPAAQALLERFDERSAHYELVPLPSAGPEAGG